VTQIPQANIPPVTVYSYWRDGQADYATYNRIVILRSHFEPGAERFVKEHGAEVALDAILIVYELAGYAGFSAYQQMRLPDIEGGRLWTLNPGTPTPRDQSYIVIGSAGFEFTPGTLAVLAQQENELKKAYPYDVYRCGRVALREVGSRRMRHLEVGLKRAV